MKYCRFGKLWRRLTGISGTFSNWIERDCEPLNSSAWASVVVLVLFETLTTRIAVSPTLSENHLAVSLSSSLRIT